MANPSPQLETWMNELLGTLLASDKTPQLDRFEVLFAGDDQVERLRVLRVEDRPEEAVLELGGVFARLVQQTCEQHAQTVPAGASLRYAVQAFRSPTDVTPEAAFYLVLTGALLLAQPTGSTPAAAQGQLIRHNETLHSMMMNMVQSVAGRLARDLEEERNARQAAERRAHEVFALREQLLDRQHERSMEAQREERDAQAKSQLLSLVVQLAPAVLARLAPKGSEPSALTDAAHPAVLRDRVVANLVKGLSAEEIQKIVTSVKPATQAVLLQLIDTYEQDLSAAPSKPPASAQPPEN